jgi:flagellar export protein FliJ
VKRYQFRLDRVLGVRRITEDQARAALLAARLAEQAAAATLAARKDAYAARPSAPAVQSTCAFLSEQFLASTSAAAVQVAGQRRDAATLQVAEDRDAWVAAHRQVEALERLDERRREEHALEAQRAADAEVDDLVVARFRRQAQA